MKAISLRQPRAEQVIAGSKQMDVRTWQVHYRGPLVIHAGAKQRKARIRELGFDPGALPYGVVVGVVDLIEIVVLDEEAYEAARKEHLSDQPFPGTPCYGWRFRAPRRLGKPVAVRGRTGIFDVPDKDIASPYPQQPPTGAVLEAGTGPDPGRPFVLYTLPTNGNGYRVALYQWIQRYSEHDAHGQLTLAPGAFWGIELGGDALRAVSGHLLAALRDNKYRATDLARTHRRPFYLDEITGIRLGLVFMAVKPLSRYDRVEAIAHGIDDMSDEEAYYWFSKCSAGPQASRAQKALRILLADD